MRAPEAGYATPAAAVISMAVAVVVIAGMTRATAELRLARAELERSEVEYALAGAHQAALLAIATSSRPPPYRWSLPSLGQAFDVVAEPERPKMSPRAAAELDDAVLDGLGVSDREAFRHALLAMRVERTLPWPADASAAMAWRACAPAMVSVYGVSETLTPQAYAEPAAGVEDSRWRAGEAWRVSITDQNGWRDERIVRFTGNGLNPAAVIARRLTRGWKEIPECDLINAAA